MSTLAEIEAAVEALPDAQAEQLMAVLTKRFEREPESSPVLEDPLAKMIGAFDGPENDDARRAEDILYGAES